MGQGLRSALAVMILGAVVQFWAAQPARAEISPNLLVEVEAAMQHEAEDAMAAALQALIEENISLAVEIAVAAVGIDSASCGAIASVAASAAPDQALDIAKGIVGVQPLCAGDVIAGISEVLPDFAEKLAAVVTAAIEGPADKGFSVPITPVTGTAENPSTDSASPTT